MIDKDGQLETIAVQLLHLLGEDVNREGLQDTPRRFAQSWRDFIDYVPGNADTTFEAVSVDQMVIVAGIHVWSCCEHHLLPFECTIHVGYITRGKVLGLSKFARIAQQYAHRLQLQERLCSQIADEVSRLTESPDVAVVAEGQHLCAAMRGVKQDLTMHTSVMLGVFREKPEARQEFLLLVKR